MHNTFAKDVVIPCAGNAEVAKSIAIREMSELGVVIFHNLFINLSDRLCYKRDVG